MKRKPFFILIPVALIFGLSGVVFFLWNQLMPDIFQLPEISYWQAMGLFILGRLLFGSFGFGKHRHKGGPPHLREKWSELSDEEKEQFREQWKKRCSKREQ